MGEMNEEEQALAGEVVHAVSRRDELRARIAHGRSGRLEAMDVAALVGIGLLGALPTSPGREIPRALRPYVGGGAMFRSQLVAQMQAGNASLPIASLLDVVRAEGGDIGLVTNLVGAAENAGLLPDFEDGFETLETKVLTDWWCERRGWKDGQQVFHEAKALAYGVNFALGAFVNPDPLAFGLAAWHWYRAIRASRATTDALLDLIAIAVEEGRRTIDANVKEIGRTDGARPVALAPRSFTDDDDGSFLDPSSDGVRA